MPFQKLPPMGSLEAFFAVAERRSLKAAAPELNISISALSRRIQTLEAHVGAALFDRGARSLTLTREGAALREAIAASFERLQDSIGALTPAAAAAPKSDAVRNGAAGRGRLRSRQSSPTE